MRSAIFAGSGNLIESNSTASFIGGGQSNQINARAINGVVPGGFGNVIQADCTASLIGGGLSNIVSFGSYVTTIGGGQGNWASAPWATIGGGAYNIVNTHYGTVGGGYNNQAAGTNSTVGGGSQNTAYTNYSTVAGGWNNNAFGNSASVGGGAVNVASNFCSTVGGGNGNWASGDFATVPGGINGRATNEGAFVWSGVDANNSGSVYTYSTNNRSFTVRATGGVRFITTDIDSTAVTNGAYNTNNSTSLTNGVYLGPGSGAWASLSDSNAKTKVSAIKPREILAKLSQLPVTEWEYKAAPHRRYIGPMAQDFHAAFGLGDDDKSITTLDSDGVMYAAIQGLVEELKDRDKTIEELKAKSARCEARNEEFARSIEVISERLNSLPPTP